MEQKQEITKVPKAKPMVVDDSEFSMLLDTNKFEHAWRVANVLCKSDLVPQQYKNKPENCVLALNWATRLEIDPIQLMQKTYIIQGKPGMEAQLVIALVNERGPFEAPIQYRLQGEGENRSCTAFATHKTSKEVCEATVTWAMVTKEGWNKKAGSKWLTMPDQMFRYRSATFLARLYCPEVILGFSTKEELEDVAGVEERKNEVVVSPLQQRIKPVENEALDPEPEPEPVPTPEQGCVEREDNPNARKAVCIKCQQKFWKRDLARTPHGFVCQKCLEPKEEPKEQSPLAVAPEERYYCEGCGHVDADAGHTADGTLKCINCLATKVIDRKTFVDGSKTSDNT
jgi:hypothetical protein